MWARLVLIVSRLRFAWSRRRVDDEIRGELEAHLALLADRYVHSGMTPEEARLAARQQLGSVRAHAGRLLTEADDRKGCGSPGAVLSYAFWQARYGGNPGAIGQTITLDRRRFDVIGVAQPGFFGVEVGRAFDVALPLCAEPLIRGPQPATGRRDAWWLDIIGRLKPDWTLERAQSHVAGMSPDIFRATVSPSYKPEIAKAYTSFTLTATSAATGASNLRNAYAPQLWVLLGATGWVLLLTCANLANLTLARSSARGREIAVRLAIGASRRRVVRQLLTESALVSGLGAAGGLLLA